MKMIKAFCAECGAPYWIANNAAHRTNLCVPHRKERRRARERKRENEVRRSAGVQARRKEVDEYIPQYRVIRDPDETWGFRSYLDWDEIKALLKQEYLEPGTCFEQRKTGEKLEVREIQGRLVVQEMAR